MKASIFPKLSGAFLEDLRHVSGSSSLSKYEMDPIGFIENVLEETLTDDLETLCNSVLHNTVTIAKSANAVGKTFVAARLAVWFFLCREESQVYTAAAPPEDNLRRLLWGEIGDVYMRHKKIFRGCKKSGLFISRGPLDFISGVTIPSSGTREERVAKFSGKHRRHLMFLLDEGDAIPDEVYEGIETCISGGTMVRVLIMFNPRRASGHVYRLEKSGAANVVELHAFRHPNVIAGQDVIPGAVTRERTVFRINEYCRRLTKNEEKDGECFKLPAYLAGATAETGTKGVFYPPLKKGWYKPTESSFSYMVLARYPAQSSSQLISREWIDAAVDRWREWVNKYGEKPPGKTLAVMGVDVAEMGDDSNALCLRWGPWVSPIKTWGETDTDTVALRLIGDYRSTKVLRACIDGTGVGSSVAPHMLRKGCVAHTVKVAESPTRNCDMGEFRILRDQLAWSVREFLRNNPHSMIPPDDMLVDEMMAIEYEIKNGKIEITKGDELKERLKRSPDRFWSLAMTFFEPKPLFSKWDSRNDRKSK